MRRLLPLVLFTLRCVPLFAQAPVAILFDASYSMALEEDGRSRESITKAAVLEWIERRDVSERYLLYSVSHESEIVNHTPAPVGPSGIEAHLTEIIPWGAVDLRKSIEAVRLDLAQRRLSSAMILVATDGEDPDALLTPLPASDSPTRFGDVEFLIPRMLVPTEARRRTMSAFLGTPGAPPPETVTRLLVQPSAAGPGRYEADIQRRQTRRDQLDWLRESVSRWSRWARFAFPFAALLGLVGAIRGYLWHRSRRLRVQRHNQRPAMITILVRSPERKRVEEIATYPASPVNGVVLEAQNDAIWINADPQIRINGMSRSTHQLQKGDILRAGGYRITVTGLEKKRRLRAPRNLTRRYAAAPAIALLVAAVAFLFPAPTATAARAAAALAGPAPPAPRSPAPSAADTLTAAPVVWSKPIVHPPGSLPAVDLDYLLIHAHPDDEAIDFGGIVPRLSDAGLVGAVMLLTDGGAGRDQFPWRSTGEFYPAYDLSGVALESVRIREATESIGWMGVDHYLRVGLPNYPYNSIDQELTPEEVIRLWHEEMDITGWITETVGRLEPEIVLSPDTPGFAREHFEHDATGLIVRAALERVQAQEPGAVVAHVRSIDPMQTEGYPDLVPVPAWSADSVWRSPREQQLRALLAHKTQRDATAIGLETRLALPVDYFRVTLLTSRAQAFERIPPALHALLGGSGPED